MAQAKRGNERGWGTAPKFLSQQVLAPFLRSGDCRSSVACGDSEPTGILIETGWGGFLMTSRRGLHCQSCSVPEPWLAVIYISTHVASSKLSLPAQPLQPCSIPSQLLFRLYVRPDWYTIPPPGPRQRGLRDKRLDSSLPGLATSS